MDLKQLDYFVHVADASSFSKAAQLLSVAQPALSRQIRALEVELRQVLFLRNGRGVTLTPAGGRLLAHARGILQQVERVRAELDESRIAPVGRVALGVPPSVSRVGLVKRYVLEVFPWTSHYALKALRGGYPQGIVDGHIFYLNPLQRFASNELWNEPIERNEPIIAMRTVSGGNIHRLRDVPSAAW